MTEKVETIESLQKKEVSPFKKKVNMAIDIIAIFSAVLNIGFTVLMLSIGLGNNILNIIMLSFLGVQLLFPLIKLIFGFNSFSSSKIIRVFKMCKKWFARVFKLALAIYLIYSIVVINQTTESPIFAIFGALITIIFFVISSLLDLAIFIFKTFAKNKLKDIKDNILQNKNELFSILMAKTDSIKQPDMLDELAVTKESEPIETTKKKKGFLGIFKRKKKDDAENKIQPVIQPKKELTLDDVTENISVKKDRIFDIVFKKKNNDNTKS